MLTSLGRPRSSWEHPRSLKDQSLVVSGSLFLSFSCIFKYMNNKIFIATIHIQGYKNMIQGYNHNAFERNRGG